MDFKVYSETTESMTHNANIVKDLLLQVLEEKGLLRDTAENVGSRFAVIIAKPSTFGRVWAKLRGNEDVLTYQIVEATDLVVKPKSKGNG